MTLGETKEELIAQIRTEMPYIDIKPYSHNIIGIVLGQIAEKFGDTEAENTIKELHLDKRGW
ncbi:MAG: hypothetical protein KJI69_03580 [Patescibacteria group bacterium]|nr:hypothetical protein [Patescibacteria group bacterium]